MRHFISLLLFCMSLPVFANPQAIYNKITRANGFWVFPKLITKQSDQVQASQNGAVILLYRGMAAHVRNNDEMAWVLSHELAHYKMGHRGSTHPNEYAADKMAVTYMKRAGYNSCTGVKILLRMSYPSSNSHPASKDRYNRVKC